ncbi:MULTISPECIES: AAA family ATPase [unclassified Saccharicrinis]|uniref:AAA family ATPase n=1 Tax=unclassified Saccharicrinis TaxID=2646859 RepID=UPI003D34B455
MDKATPFTYGKLTNAHTFANRTKEIEHLGFNFRGGVNTIIISPRRWGKSSLVEEAARRIKDKHIKIAFLDLYDTKTEKEFYFLLANEVIKACTSKAEDFFNNAKGIFRHLIPKISYSPAQDQKIDIEFNWEQVQKNPSEILDMAESLAIAKNIRLVVCMDEFQNIGSFKKSLDFQKKLRAHWQRHQHVTYCLYGSKRSMLIEFFSSSRMPFYKFGDIILLEKISGLEWEKFIIRRFKSTQKKIGTPIARLIHEYAEQHSYYVQQLAQQCWLRTETVCTEEIVENALESLINQLSLLFHGMTDLLPTTQVRFLNALLDNQTSLTSKKVLEKYQLGTSSNVKRIKQALVQKEIIDIMGKDINILDPIYKHWLRRFYFR